MRAGYLYDDRCDLFDECPDLLTVQRSRQLRFNRLHVGCVFDHDVDLPAESCEQCTNCAERGKNNQCTVVRIEGKLTVYNPHVCLFGDHTRLDTTDIIIAIDEQMHVNKLRYRGTHFSLAPAKHYAAFRDIEQLGIQPAAPKVKGFDVLPMHMNVIRDVLFAWYIGHLTERFDTRPIVLSPTRNRIDPWYEAFLNMRALRAVCRYFAYHHGISRRVAVIQVPYRRYILSAGSHLLRDGPKQTAPTNSHFTTIKLDTCVTYPMLLRRVILIHHSALKGYQRVGITIANYHQAPMLPQKCYTVFIEVSPQLTQIMSKLLHISRLFQYCGHGFDGYEYVYVNETTRAKNIKHMSVAQRIMKLIEQLDSSDTRPLYIKPKNPPKKKLKV